MFTGMEAMACPNLAVPAQVMQHIVRIESGANRYAIGVVGGHLVRQPKTLAEAVATVHMLDARGYNFSVGVAQVNRTNLAKYGLDSYPKAFNTCANLAAGARILSDCYKRSGADWGKAFSCYYSGNFVTGYRDGYVQKVYASMRTSEATGRSQTIQIALDRASPNSSDRSHTSNWMSAGNAKRRMIMRTVALDPSKAGTGSTVPTSLTVQRKPGTTSHGAASAQPRGTRASRHTVSASNVGTTNVFEPRVSGPGDLVSSPTTLTTSQDQHDAKDPTQRMHSSEESRDAAFVF